MQALTDRYSEHLAGVLSCYDRILITTSAAPDCGVTEARQRSGLHHPSPSSSLTSALRRSGLPLCPTTPGTVKLFYCSPIERRIYLGYYLDY
jgi:hypothetical protein